MMWMIRIENWGRGCGWVFATTSAWRLAARSAWNGYLASREWAHTEPSYWRQEEKLGNPTAAIFSSEIEKN